MIEREYPGNHAGTERRGTYPSHWLLQRFYYQLRLIQEIDRRVLQETVHLSPGAHALVEHRNYGAEVCDVGIINAIDLAKDVVFSTYRERIHTLISSDDITGYVTQSTRLTRKFDNSAQAPGSKSTTCPGEGGKHKDLEQCAADAISAALMSKLTGKGAVSVVFVTEETLVQGQLEQFFCVASLWSLPILCVLNTTGGLAGDSTALHRRQMNLKTLEGEQLATQSIVANDVLKVYAFASAAIAFIRSNCRPFLLHLITNPSHETSASASDETPGPVADSGDIALRKMANKLSLIDQRRIESTIARRIETALQEAQFART